MRKLFGKPSVAKSSSTLAGWLAGWWTNELLNRPISHSVGPISSSSFALSRTALKLKSLMSYVPRFQQDRSTYGWRAGVCKHGFGSVRLYQCRAVGLLPSPFVAQSMQLEGGTSPSASFATISILSILVQCNHALPRMGKRF